MTLVFWNVDTQYDFMKTDGKLSVPEAESIESNLERLTRLARITGTKVVNTADWHTKDSREIATGEFPEHCMAGTEGAEYVDATKPNNPFIVSWQDKTVDLEALAKHEGDVIIRKDEFSAFHPTGAPYTGEVLKALDVTDAVVYGVATDYCVNYAVSGLLAEGINVTVVNDAIKGLAENTSNEAMIHWRSNNARFASTEEIERMLGGEFYGNRS